MNPEKTAILIFANSPEEEAVQKPFYKSVDLFQELNFRTLQMVRKTGIPFFHFTEKEQTGNSFGERYVNAIETVFKKGFENIITIGADTPQLHEKHLLEAVEKLKTTPLVMGPSTDGGYYLLGLSKSLFKRTIFLNLPWQTPQLRISFLKNVLPQVMEVTFLETFIDIDHVSDIGLLLKKVLPKQLIQILTLFVRNKKGFFHKKNTPKYRYYLSTFFNKGSPLFPDGILS